MSVPTRPPTAVSNENAQPRSVFSAHMIVLERTAGPRLPAWAGPEVAATMRSSLLAHCASPGPMLLSGHEALGGPAQRDHLAIVPLPDIGRPGASGALLGVALVYPRHVSSEALGLVHEALAAWHRDGAALRMGRQGRWILTPRPIGGGHELRPWYRASTQWDSATPVVLDRFPGPLHDPRPHRRARAQQRARASIISACQRIGLPAPVHIELHDHPILPGSLAARRFPSYPAHGPCRVRVHVRLRFDGPVEGPMLLGAGRYRGLGLMRATGDQTGSNERKNDVGEDRSSWTRN